MAEENVPAPTRTDAQLVHVKACLPIRKTFTASADVPSIYVQQFWNTLRKDTKSGEFSFQLDELWFNLNGDLIRNALGITPKEFTHPFVPPPDDDLLIEFTNNMGYPEELHFVSKMCVNSLYHPWSTVISMIYQYLTSKISGSDRPKYPKYLEIAARKPRQPTTMTGEEVEMKKKASKAGKSKQPAPAKQPKPAKKKSSKPTPSKKSPKERDFTNDADMEQSNSKTDTKILKVEEEQGKEVSNIVALDETTIKLDEGQAGSNPSKTPVSQALPEIELIKKTMLDHTMDKAMWLRLYQALNPYMKTSLLQVTLKILRMLLPLVINSLMKNQRKKNWEKLIWKLKLNPWSLFLSIKLLH
nr:hypothetical protein [Tanacetum cinerariifolium]